MSSAKRTRTTEKSGPKKRARTDAMQSNTNMLAGLAAVAASLNSESLTPFGRALLEASLVRPLVTPAPAPVTTSTPAPAPAATSTTVTPTPTVKSPTTPAPAPAATSTTVTPTPVAKSPMASAPVAKSPTASAPVAKSPTTPASATTTPAPATTTPAPATTTSATTPELNVTEIHTLPRIHPSFPVNFSYNCDIITPEAIENEQFFSLYFKRAPRNRVTTTLIPGTLIVVENPNGLENMIVVTVRPNPLVIQVYNITKNALEIFHPAPNMYIRTFRKTYSSVNFFGRNVDVGDHIMVVIPTVARLLNIDHCHGTVTEIFSYAGIDMVFVLAMTPCGYRVWIQPFMRNFVRLLAIDRPSQLLEDMLSVTLGTRVQNDRGDTGTVAMILYQESSNIPHYMIISSGRMIFNFFHDRVLPVSSPGNIVRNNALTYLCALQQRSSECFLHRGVALRTVTSWNDRSIVALERGHNHYLNRLQNDDPSHAIRGFFIFSLNLTWSKFGFIIKPREKKEVKCSLTGKITTYDYEE